MGELVALHSAITTRHDGNGSKSFAQSGKVKGHSKWARPPDSLLLFTLIPLAYA